MTKVESYNQCCETENIIDEKISKVLENGTAKEYDNLLKEETKIKQIMKGLFSEYKLEQFSSCKHISAAIYHLDEYDRSRTYVKCVKCGLDDSILLDARSYFLPPYSSEEQAVMEEFLYKTGVPCFGVGIHGGVKIYNTSFETINNLYQEMKNNNPNLTDLEFLVECLKRGYISKYLYKEQEESENINERPRVR